ncbi:uncharacterized protein LOC135484302 [Lineus longissimus]|uniref:uncharacterized protein LOC135484302 n=1 Tax=Lineus longissimus TaxID=88925 RepID=UPI002B4E721C
MSSEKYEIDQNDRVGKPDRNDSSASGCVGSCQPISFNEIKENVRTPGCEPIRPDRGNWIYTGVILGVGTLAIIAGTFTGRGTAQGMQVYATQVKSTSNQIVSMLSVSTVFKLVQLYLPGDTFFTTANVTQPPYNITIGNVSYFVNLSSTQSLQDFESGWTVIFDRKKSICYLQPMNRTHMGTFEEFTRALVQGDGHVVNTVTNVTEIGWSVRKALDTEVEQLTPYVRARCKNENNRIIRIVETGMPPLISGCIESYLPEYALRRNETGKDRVHLVDIKMIPKLNLADCPLIS